MKYYNNLLCMIFINISMGFSAYGMNLGKSSVGEPLSEQPSLSEHPLAFLEAGPQVPDDSIFSRANRILKTDDDNKTKKKLLQALYQENLEQKPDSNHRKDWHQWLGNDEDIKKAYERLKAADITDKLVGRNRTPSPFISSTALQNDLADDLNRSRLFDIESPTGEEPLIPRNKQSAYPIFSQASEKLLTLLKDRKASLDMVDKKEIIEDLDNMTAFIYTYDLYEKEKEAPHISERCWLLELIKNTILDKKALSVQMIDDWIKEIQRITNVTDKSVHPEKYMDLFKGSMIELQQERKANEANEPIITTPAIALSTDDLLLKAELKRLLQISEDRIKSDVFNTTLLSNYLGTLKQYKELLLPTEQKEIKRISKLIKTTAYRIKRLMPIAPRSKPVEERIAKNLASINKMFEQQDLPKLVTTLEGYLLVEPNYDASKVITDTSSKLYDDIITTLQKATITLNDLANKTPNKSIDINYFRTLLPHIEKLQYLLATDSENEKIKKMIASYDNRIQIDTDQLTTKITGRTGSFIGLKPDGIRAWINNAFPGEYLRPYKEQLLEVVASQEKELARREKEKEEEIDRKIAEAKTKQQAILEQTQTQQRLDEAKRRAAMVTQTSRTQARVEPSAQPSSAGQGQPLAAAPQPGAQQPTIAEQPATQPIEPQYEMMEPFALVGKGIAYVVNGIVSIASAAWNWLTSLFR